MINVAILGYGVVGSGVAEVLRKNSKSIKARAGQEIKVARILDIRDFPDSPDAGLFTKNADDIFNDKSIDIVVETIGGEGIAFEFTKRAFESGKSVVTSNKEIVAAHGPELLKMAADHGVQYLFEASVGGGIPIIHPLSQCLAANEISGVAGILNGTTNYILTKMKKDGLDFGTALKGAQKNGYAEADPTNDVEGFDSCRKLAILSSIAYNEFVNYKDIYTEGIGKVDVADIKYAEAMNSVIKLIAVSSKLNGKIFARVSPVIISEDNPLSGVEDVFNAILVRGDSVGDAMFYGKGAGKLPTASAVVADIIDIVMHPDSICRYVWDRDKTAELIDIGDSTTRYFIRLQAEDVELARKSISDIFGKVSFVHLIEDEPGNEMAFKTGDAKEGELSQAVEELEKAAGIKSITSTIRILEEN
jgi:homoserine dehydrogenase